jgi:RHS repeat-associated protein
VGYTGHREDVGSGLVYAKARYYDPDTKMFLSSKVIKDYTIKITKAL